MLGSFEGARLARDGVTIIDDTNAFAQEWQVRPGVDGSLFETIREPQYPVKCKMPLLQPQESRRLKGSLSNEAATDACGHLADRGTRSRCIFDVLATQDLEVAEGGTF